MQANLANDRYFKKQVHLGRIHVNRTGHVSNAKGELIGYRIKSSGYFAIGLRDKSNKVRHILIHRLVYLIYHGKILKGYEINHIDGDKSNNKPQNLESVTSSENNKHAYDIGLKHVSEEQKQFLREKFQGELCSSSKLTNKQVLYLRKIATTKKYTRQQLADKFGVGKTSITDAINRKTFKHI